MTDLIGKGIYTSSEASRLTGVPIWSIRRWSQGYRYRYLGKDCYSKPAIGVDIGKIENQIALTFADLIEIRVLHAFIKKGVSWKALRIAFDKAKEILGLKHPLSSKRFHTDGHAILLDVGDKTLLDVVKNQYEFKKILSPFMHNDIMDFEDDKPLRWWPLGKNKNVVLDPTRSFGAPIISTCGIPTWVIRKAVEADQSYKEVAHWFEVSPKNIKQALEFEHRIAA